LNVPLIRRSVPCLLPCIILLFLSAPAFPQSAKLRFEISFSAASDSKPLDGHILLGIATTQNPEPRFQLREEEAASAQFFGLDVDNWKPGTPAVIDSGTLGYPLKTLADLPPGDYYIQAVLNIYETFHRADGHTVKLPPDMGEGQHWNEKPGNLMNKPILVHLDPESSTAVRILLDQKIPPIPAPHDTKYIKPIRSSFIRDISNPTGTSSKSSRPPTSPAIRWFTCNTRIASIRLGLPAISRVC